MEKIEGYRLLTEFSSQSSGTSQWCFGEKDGKEYFIKRFLSPIFPQDNSELSPRLAERRRQACYKFYEEKRLFYNELKKCNTGNNIIVEDFFLSGSKYYVATERVKSPGGDIKIACKLSEEKKITLIRAILYSISKLHEKKIVHADIKADNILLKETTKGYYTAKIIDFDGGFLIDSIPENVQCDFVYMAPESFMRLEDKSIALDEKIDIFALGILFCQYLTGELPQLSRDYNYVFEAVLDHASLSFASGIQAWLMPTIKSMLSRNPENRPSAREVLKVIREKKDGPDKDEGAVSHQGFYIPKELD